MKKQGETTVLTVGTDLEYKPTERRVVHGKRDSDRDLWDLDGHIVCRALSRSVPHPPDVVYTGTMRRVDNGPVLPFSTENLPYKSSWMTIFAAILLVPPPFLVSAYGHAWWIGGVGPIMLFLLVFSYESTP